jgi:PTS system galactitol-specific IIB component
MKRIIIACGSGVATSTVANQKVTSYLNEHGYSGKYQITQCQVSELAEKAKNADFAIATTVVGGGIDCPVLAGLPLLTGIGVDKLYADIEEQMKK